MAWLYNGHMRYHASVPGWIRDLRVGDMFCDCGYRHCTIVAIEDEHVSGAGWLLWLPLWRWRCLDWFDRAVRRLYTRMGWDVVYDRRLITADGRSCSARHCCWPIDHEERGQDQDGAEIECRQE